VLTSRNLLRCQQFRDQHDTRLELTHSQITMARSTDSNSRISNINL